MFFSPLSYLYKISFSVLQGELLQLILTVLPSFRRNPSNLSAINNGVSNTTAFIFFKAIPKPLRRINISAELLIGTKKGQKKKKKKKKRSEILIGFVSGKSLHIYLKFPG